MGGSRTGSGQAHPSAPGEHPLQVQDRKSKTGKLYNLLSTPQAPKDYLSTFLRFIYPAPHFFTSDISPLSAPASIDDNLINHLNFLPPTAVQLRALLCQRSFFSISSFVSFFNNASASIEGFPKYPSFNFCLKKTFQSLLFFIVAAFLCLCTS